MVLKPILTPRRDSHTAAGGPGFERYLHNPVYEMELQSVTELKCVFFLLLLLYIMSSRIQRIRLQLPQRSSSTSLNVTLFRSSHDSKSIGKHIITSGPYSDAISGVVTPQVSLNPGKYLIIPSTYHPGFTSGFRMTVYSSAANLNITMRTPRG